MKRENPHHKIHPKTILLLGVVIGLVVSLPAILNRQQPTTPAPEVVAIATLNGTPIPLDQYQLYLRENVHFFQDEMGDALWQENFAGMTATEFIKSQTLEFFAVVVWALHHTNHPYHELTPTERTRAHQEAYTLWHQLTSTEQELFSFDTLYTVRQEVILHNNIRDYLTRHYVEHQRIDVFLRMFADWRATAELDIDTDKWGELDIQVFAR